jgi:anti-sigma factor RsiW
VNSTSQVSEADMQAYADGLLAPERAARVRSYLARRPDEARRVAFYGRLNVQMQSIFDTADASGTEHTLRRPPMRDRVPLAVAIIACLALILATLFATVRVPDEALERATMEALMIDTPFTPAPADTPDLSAAGFRAVGVHTVTLGAFSTADAITYRNARQERLVLLSMRGHAAAARTQWSARRIGGARLFEWTSAGGVRTIVGGHAGTHGLMRAADLLTERQSHR